MNLGNLHGFRGVKMDYIAQIKKGVEKLYQNNPNVHISLSKTHPKINVSASPAKIVGVYKNIFRIEERENGKLPVHHSIQYGDILIGQVVIEELDFVRPVIALNKK